MKRFNNKLSWPAAFVFVIVLLLSACEPNGWNYIVEPPEPLTELYVTGVGAGINITIDIQFRVPTFGILDLPWPADELNAVGPDAIFYLLLEGAPDTEKFYVGEASEEIMLQSGELISLMFAVEKTNLQNGGSYILLGYTISFEGQLSTPAQWGPFVISW